jgi:hypothetical protein
MPKVDWKVVGRLMGGRTARQCRERYRNYLAPAVRIAPWTEAEESLLVAKFAELGPKWSQMTIFFDRRSAVSLKNHYAKISQRFRAPPPPDGDAAEDDDRGREAPAPAPLTVQPLCERKEKEGVVVSMIRTVEKVGEAWFSSEADVKFTHVVHL